MNIVFYQATHMILCDGQKEARESQEKEKPAESGCFPDSRRRGMGYIM